MASQISRASTVSPDPGCLVCLNLYTRAWIRLLWNRNSTGMKVIRFISPLLQPNSITQSTELLYRTQEASLYLMSLSITTTMVLHHLLRLNTGSTCEVKSSFCQETLRSRAKMSTAGVVKCSPLTFSNWMEPGERAPLSSITCKCITAHRRTPITPQSDLKVQWAATHESPTQLCIKVSTGV